MVPQLARGRAGVQCGPLTPKGLLWGPRSFSYGACQFEGVNFTPFSFTATFNVLSSQGRLYAGFRLRQIWVNSALPAVLPVRDAAPSLEAEHAGHLQGLLASFRAGPHTPGSVPGTRLLFNNYVCPPLLFLSGPRHCGLGRLLNARNCLLLKHLQT